MKKTVVAVIAVSFIIALLMGCAQTPQKTTDSAIQAKVAATVSATAAAVAEKNKEKSPQTTVQVVMENSPEAQAALFKLAQQDPTITDPQTGGKFFIMPVKPKAGIDYKIIQIKPDPNIDYKMIIAGPKSQIELQKFRKQIADAIQKQTQQPKNKDK
jgi:hypothetical protein